MQYLCNVSDPFKKVSQPWNWKKLSHASRRSHKPAAGTQSVSHNASEAERVALIPCPAFSVSELRNEFPPNRDTHQGVQRVQIPILHHCVSLSLSVLRIHDHFESFFNHRLYQTQHSSHFAILYRKTWVTRACHGACKHHFPKSGWKQSHDVTNRKATTDRSGLSGGWSLYRIRRRWCPMNFKNSCQLVHPPRFNP